MALRVEKHAALQRLHGRVLEAVESYLAPPVAPNIRFKGHHRREELYRRFGSVFCAEHYDPHLELGKKRPDFSYDNLRQFDALANKAWDSVEFRIARIVAGNYDELGHFR